MTVAHELSRNGFEVTILAKDFLDRTTSAVAAAIWWPYDPEPVEEARPWAVHSQMRFADLAREFPESGVQVRDGVYRQRSTEPVPWFAANLQATTIERSNTRTFQMRAPLIDMPVYIRWLQARCQANGVGLQERGVTAFDELSEYDVVVNCAGLGARELSNDSTVHPLRGQVVIMHDTGITEFFKDESPVGATTYIYPRLDSVILGGTTDASDDLEPRTDVTKSIIERCIALDKRVADGTVEKVLVGLRPNRPAIRVEIERRDDTPPVVHDYGHGRCGVSLSWGCAARVVELCRSTLE